MAADDDTARPDAPTNDAPRKKRRSKRLPRSVDYPPRRARLILLPGEVQTLTIREAADRLARVAAYEETDAEQQQTLHGKYRFIFTHALCELIRSGDFQLVKPRTVSRETFARFARMYKLKLTDDPNERLPQESGVIVPQGRTQVFGLGKPGRRMLYLPAWATAVELFAVPELLARAVYADPPPTMRDETALLAETFERRLRNELRGGRVVAHDYATRDAMPRAIDWAVLMRSAVLPREQFEEFAAMCDVSVFDLPPDDAQADESHTVPKPASDAVTSRSAAAADVAPQAVTSSTEADGACVVRHRMKERPDVLGPLIARSMQEAGGAWLLGWTLFVGYANADEPEDPLVGYLAGAKRPGVRYKDGAETKTLTKNAYMKRVKPNAR